MTDAVKSNLEMIKLVASRLGPLRDKVVFLGGAATSLMITDSAAPEVRSTLDVDVIVELTSRFEYYKLEEMLRELGFRHSMDPDEPICRWIIDDVKVDVMPTDEKILGFSNKWYSKAIDNSIEIEIEANLHIRIVTAPYFLATKIEAFYGRGNGDFLVSHDMEDIITLIDGRPEIVEEIVTSPENLKNHLADQFRVYLELEQFLESISGHLRPDKASQARFPIIMERIGRIAQIQ